MEFALKSEIYCFIHLHSPLRIVFVHNIYYIFAKLSLANIRPRFSNKPIVHSRHRGRCTQKFKNNHFTFLKSTELRLFNRKESQSNSPVQLSSPAVQSNCPVQLSSPVQSMFCTMPSKTTANILQLIYKLFLIDILCQCTFCLQMRHTVYLQTKYKYYSHTMEERKFF